MPRPEENAVYDGKDEGRKRGGGGGSRPRV